MSPSRFIAFLTTTALLLAQAKAVILYRTGDPSENTTAPDTLFPHDGWDYEGLFGGFLGTPIAPQFFITAKHIGVQDTKITFGATDYPIVASYPDPASDLHIYQVSTAFPYFAQLYSRGDESGQRIVEIGRGTRRGGEILLGTELRGWRYGASDGIERWGENVIAGAFAYGPEWQLLYADFDQAELADECHLSNGDSGGAAFINDNGTWKLAGINYAVDGPFYTDANGAGQFNGALFDLRGFYYFSAGTYVLIDAANLVPSSFYPTRISTKLQWIYSVTDPAGDLDFDGIPNLLEYALHSDPLTPTAQSIPAVGRESNFLTLTYTKVSTASDITYSVERSGDLVHWTGATTIDDLIATSGNLQTIKAKVDVTGLDQLFLRLKITRP